MKRKCVSSKMFELRRVFVSCVLLIHFSVIVWSSPDASTVNALYEEAFQTRTKLTSSKSDLRKTGALLLQASGLTYDQLKHPSPVPTNLTLNAGLLREFSFALETGQGLPRNELLAFQFIKRAAELGDPIAHGEMFLRYSFGFYQESNYKNGRLASFDESDVAMGLVHGTFGALENDTVSQMSLGYRHMIGHGVPRNCPSAVAYYNAVAEKVIELSKLPDSLPMIDKLRLSSRNSHGSRKVKVEQWLQYYQYSADLGDVEAQTTVGQIFNYGTHGIKRDYSRAFYYFQQAAEAGNPAAMGHLGHMYANGLSVVANNKTAIEWFSKAIEGNDANGQYGMGYMYLTGFGVERSYKKALEYFSQASRQDHTEAEFHLGVMHLKGLATRVSPVKALAYFTAASNGGHLLAMYNLAMMHVSGTGIEPNCNSAVKLLKQVAEQGPWSIVLQKAHDAFSEGDYTYGLISYLRAAQMGLELGQSNAAWMLEHGLAPGRLSENIHLALKMYKWSAEQENTNSLLAVGDVFYYGRGIEKDWNRSSGIYQLAEKQKSSRAAFNLGFMHQFGAGLPKDLHLAKRYYDLAADYNSDAFYAAFFAVFYLRLQEFWESIRSFVPGLVVDWIDVLFTCKYSEANRVPPGWWSGRREDGLRDPGQRSTLSKVMEALDIDTLSEMIGAAFDVYTSEDLGDLLESIFLAVLIIVFLLVYRRRNVNRGQQRRNQQQQIQNPVVPIQGPVEDVQPEEGVEQPVEAPVDQPPEADVQQPVPEDLNNEAPPPEE